MRNKILLLPPFSAHLKVIVCSLKIFLQLHLHVLGLDQLHAGLVVVVLERGEVLQQLLAVFFVFVGDQLLLVKLQGEAEIFLIELFIF